MRFMIFYSMAYFTGSLAMVLFDSDARFIDVVMEQIPLIAIAYFTLRDKVSW